MRKNKSGTYDSNQAFATKMCPQKSMIVYVFPIEKTYLVAGRTDYDSTRKCWPINAPEQYNADYGVGVVKGISKTGYSIDNALWEDVNDKGKMKKAFQSPRNCFNPSDAADPRMVDELLNKDWTAILSQNGYWQHGGVLVVEFDGKGRYRILRGSKDKAWKECS